MIVMLHHPSRKLRMIRSQMTPGRKRLRDQAVAVRVAAVVAVVVQQTTDPLRMQNPSSHRPILTMHRSKMMAMVLGPVWLRRVVRLSVLPGGVVRERSQLPRSPLDGVEELVKMHRVANGKVPLAENSVPLATVIRLPNETLVPNAIPAQLLARNEAKWLSLPVKSEFAMIVDAMSVLQNLREAATQTATTMIGQHVPREASVLNAMSEGLPVRLRLVAVIRKRLPIEIATIVTANHAAAAVKNGRGHVHVVSVPKDAGRALVLAALPVKDRVNQNRVGHLNAASDPLSPPMMMPMIAHAARFRPSKCRPGSMPSLC